MKYKNVIEVRFVNSNCNKTYSYTTDEPVSVGELGIVMTKNQGHAELQLVEVVAYYSEMEFPYKLKSSVCILPDLPCLSEALTILKEYNGATYSSNKNTK